VAGGRHVAAGRAEARATSAAHRLLPTGRSLAVGFGLLAAAIVLYVAARETSVFSVESVDVVSETAGHAGAVGEALAPLQGTSLLKVDDDVIARKLEDLPHVHLVGYDRAFPNGLRVHVAVERPVAVLRRGQENWLVSAQGRVLRKLERRLKRPLPVVWVPQAFEPEIGTLVRAEEPASAVFAIAQAFASEPRFSRSIWYVKRDTGGLTFVLRDSFELRLGDASELGLKVRVARHVLAAVRAAESDASYIDVSVPDRPVAGTTLDSQLEP
jgi:cell division septal protein FtsQ